jgi:hypothetical protein
MAPPQTRRRPFPCSSSLACGPHRRSSYDQDDGIEHRCSGPCSHRRELQCCSGGSLPLQAPTVEKQEQLHRRCYNAGVAELNAMGSGVSSSSLFSLRSLSYLSPLSAPRLAAPLLSSPWRVAATMTRGGATMGLLRGVAHVLDCAAFGGSWMRTGHPVGSGIPRCGVENATCVLEHAIALGVVYPVRPVLYLLSRKYLVIHHTSVSNFPFGITISEPTMLCNDAILLVQELTLFPQMKMGSIYQSKEKLLLCRIKRLTLRSWVVT